MTWKETKEKKWKMTQKQACMRSGSRPSPEETRSLFTSDMVSPMMRPADGQQQKNGRKDQTNTAKMRAETKPKKRKVDRNEVVGFVEFGLPGVSR